MEPDLSLPNAESTQVEDTSYAEPDTSLPITEEPSLQDPTPAEQSSSPPPTRATATVSRDREEKSLTGSALYIQKLTLVGPLFGSTVIISNAATTSTTTRHKLGH